jgi:hypothetical protein
MKLWKVETASGPAYVQAKSSDEAFAIAEARYGRGNVTGAGPARGTGDPLKGAAILAQVKDIGVIQVGTYNGGGNLNSLSSFAESFDSAEFANNLAQNPYYSLSGPNVGGGGGAKASFAPLGDGSGGGSDEVSGEGGFGGIGSDGSGGAIDSVNNLGSVFRQYLRSTGMDPDSALGQSAFGLANPLQNMLELAQGAQMNPFIPGQPFNPQGAKAFLEQRGLQGISSGASNVINQLAGANQSNAGTEMFLRPGTQGDVGATQARSAMLAALYKMAPAWAARHGSRAIGKASDEFFDARQGGTFGSGQTTDENMLRYIKDKFGGSGIFG